MNRLHHWIPTNPVIEQYLAPPDVHEVHRARGPGAMAAFLLALIMTLAHALNLYLFLPDMVPVALPVHAVLVLATAVVARLFIRRDMDARFFMILLIATAFLGVYGGAGTLLAIVFYFWHMRSSLPFIEWFQSIFPSREPSAPEVIYDNIVIGRDEAAQSYNVVPFMDVMEAGSEKQKREALSRMTVRFDPAFAPAFRRALQDKSNTIRVQAATAVAIIEHQFSERLMQLTGLYQRMPREPAVVIALAQHYDAYAFTGILDPQRERANRDEALRLYMEYIQLMPQDEQARIYAGRLMLRGGETERAAEWFSECVRAGFRSDALTVWYIESLYAAGRYAELRAVAGQGAALIDAYRVANPALAESLMLWVGRIVPPSLAGGVV